MQPMRLILSPGRETEYVIGNLKIMIFFKNVPKGHNVKVDYSYSSGSQWTDAFMPIVKARHVLSCLR